MQSVYIFVKELQMMRENSQQFVCIQIIENGTKRQSGDGLNCTCPRCDANREAGKAKVHYVLASHDHSHSQKLQPS